MSGISIDQRVYNFSAGPATLPLPVLEQIRDEMVCFPDTGLSLLEMSHRDKRFLEVLHGAKNSIRQLLKISDDYDVLFLQGGASLQFSMIPMNLLSGSNRSAAYLVTGSWSKKAIAESIKAGSTNLLWDGSEVGYNRIPDDGDYELADDAAYLYYCSNETIQGVQFPSEPSCPESVPLVCDASSDFLCRPLDIKRYGILYACAQKNAGPAGVTVVIIRKDLIGTGNATLPGYLHYRNHAENDSEWNTPPTFAIYALGLVTKWLIEQGGVESIYQKNQDKASLLYDLLDTHPDFYQGHAQATSRSLMNVTFKLPNNSLQQVFLTEAAERGLHHLKGHRSVGGIRASIYNAMPRAGVETLASFMQDFVLRHAS